MSKKALKGNLFRSGWCEGKLVGKIHGEWWSCDVFPEKVSFSKKKKMKNHWIPKKPSWMPVFLEGYPILRSWNIRMGLVCWLFPLEFITSTAPPGHFPEAYVNIAIDVESGKFMIKILTLNVSAILGRIPLLRPTKIGNWPTGGKGRYKLPGQFCVYSEDHGSMAAYMIQTNNHRPTHLWM